MLRKIGYLLLVVGLLAVGALPVAAQNGETVDTVATIDGSGLAPIVMAKWETPDMDPVRAGTQIIPNLFPNPTPITVYAVVAHPTGPFVIDDVFFDIYEPASDCAEPTVFKTQVHMARVGEGCGAEQQQLVQDAYDDGLITFNPAYDLGDLLYALDCDKLEAHLYVGTFNYDCPQPAGYYRTIVRAVANSVVGELSNTTLEIASVVSLAVDFDTVNYGAITPGVWKPVGGDKIWGGPRPTIANMGNNPASLYVYSTPMLGAVYGKVIDDFDILLAQPRVAYEAGVLTQAMGMVPTCGVLTQIDFSIYPGAGLPADVYSGEMVLSINHAPGSSMWCN